LRDWPGIPQHAFEANPFVQSQASHKSIKILAFYLKLQQKISEKRFVVHFQQLPTSIAGFSDRIMVNWVVADFDGLLLGQL
jgi:hypothetical protein